jgi:murein DD-endopeptidase MepM/ murein hydrolase activator NlpD
MSLLLTDIIQRPLGAATNPPATDEAASREKLKTLAAQFESMLVSQLLHQMRASMFDDGEDSSNAPLADSLFAELSLAITRAGGLGFSDAMVEPLVRQSDLTAVTPARLTIGSPESVQPRPAILPEDFPAASVLGGRVSSAYGWRQDPITSSTKFHHGMDIALPNGTDVPAPQAGRVVFAGEQAGYGKTVILDHGGQLTTRYAHLSAIDVRTGDAVSAGQVFAKVGATGRATGPHLHLEVLEAGQSVNPAEKLATYAAGRPQ